MITLGLVAKDEGKYLKEWILYHKLIGINNFDIYLHNNSDNSKKILEDLGIIAKNVSSNNLGFSIKNTFYTDIISQAKTEFVCCLDIDEFIFLPTYQNINEFLSLSHFDGFGGIVLHQNIFGSNNHQKSPDGLVIENYITRHPDDLDFPKNYPDFKNPYDLFKMIKTIIRKRYFQKVLDSHEYIMSSPTVDENAELYSTYKCKRSLSNIRINHYFTKSLEDWRFKTNRPRISGASKYPDSWFDYFGSFQYQDTKIRDIYSNKINNL
jgi:hypothetical protein